MHFQITLTSDHVAMQIWFNSVLRAQRLEGEKKKERRKKEFLGKYKCPPITVSGGIIIHHKDVLGPISSSYFYSV